MIACTTSPVPARRGPSTSSYSLRWGVNHPDPIQRGHVDPSILFKRWDVVRGTLLELVFKERWHVRGGQHWKRVEMVLEGLRWQAATGHCFASAAWFAEHAGVMENAASEKTWDRCLAWLRSQGLVKVTPLFRANGQRATNLIDFSSLWALILRLLNARELRRYGHELHAKIGAFWRVFDLRNTAPLA